jgi:hypothetical protein
VAAVRHHPAFTARHWGLDDGETDPRDAFAGEPWFALACRFADEWDMRSFDPDYRWFPLEHFAPLVRRLVAGP